MMKLVTPERMKRFDEYAIREFGIPSAVLMENAGRTTYRLAKEWYLKKGDRIVIFCGKGNNGGDGFVFARYAKKDGFYVKCLLLSKKEDLRGDAALMMRVFEKMRGEIVEEAHYRRELVQEELRMADLVVDAIFGTGLSKEVEGKEREIIETINASGKTVLSIDIPSGLDGEKGKPLGAAVKATHTFTYGLPKVGQILLPGAEYVGRLTVVDICIPPSAEDDIGVDGHLIDGDLIRSFFRRRQPDAHKGSFGHVAVIAGSRGLTGAAHMASLSALRIGAGLVTLIIPKSLNPIMEVKLTEVMTRPIEDGGKGYFPLSAFEEIKDFVRDKDVIIMGPGLSREKEVGTLVRRIYAEIDKPFVIDADGINAFEGHLELLRAVKREAVVTPHPGELSRLVGTPPRQINEDRIGTGRRFVESTGLVLVLKGARTVVFDRDGTFFINPTGNPALAKGGSGDILTGFIGGLASQGYSLLESSIFSVYLHGLLADMWVEEGTEMDLLATDLLSYIGQALRKIRDGKERAVVDFSL